MNLKNDKIPLMVLAGGFGTRLQSVVSDVPKPLAPVNGKPFLSFLMDQWVNAGLRDFIFLLHHKSDLVIEYLESRPEYNNPEFNFRTITEPVPLGTGGSIANAVGKFKDSISEFFVANADTFLSNPPFSKMQDMDGNAIVIVSVDNTSRYGAVKCDGSLISEFIEKKDASGAGLINAGIYKLKSAYFKEWDGLPFSIESKLFPELVKNKELLGVHVDGNFIDIGLPDDYFKFQEWVKKGEV